MKNRFKIIRFDTQSGFVLLLVLILFSVRAVRLNAGEVIVWGGGIVVTDVPPDLTNVLAIAAGDFHALALKANGTVAAWGSDLNGACDVPLGLSDVIAVAAGADHSLALKADGRVVGWGSPPSATNVPADLGSVVAIAAGGRQSLALLSQGTVVAWGRSTNVPVGLSNVVAIACGTLHDVALKADGLVVVWGNNTFGQTNLPADLSNVVRIAAGGYNSLALEADGTLVAWGPLNEVPPHPADFKAIACGPAHDLALTGDGTVQAWGGFTNFEATNVPPSLTNAAMIQAGAAYSLAVADSAGLVFRAPFSNPEWRTSCFEVSLPSQCGRVYALEYKTALSEAHWTTLPLAAGTGATIRLLDSSPSDLHRFYRVLQW